MLSCVCVWMCVCVCFVCVREREPKSRFLVCLVGYIKLDQDRVRIESRLILHISSLRVYKLTREADNDETMDNFIVRLLTSVKACTNTG
jgi:hypothetical protein